MGLVALWREGLLAQKVLQDRTRGYKNHPQLERFRTQPDPLLAIGCYLREVRKEAEKRGYRFAGGKVVRSGRCRKINIRIGQKAFEWSHLLGKLKRRDLAAFQKNSKLVKPRMHPLFNVISGGIEKWERGTSRKS